MNISRSSTHPWTKGNVPCIFVCKDTTIVVDGVYLTILGIEKHNIKCSNPEFNDRVKA